MIFFNTFSENLSEEKADIIHYKVMIKSAWFDLFRIFTSNIPLLTTASLATSKIFSTSKASLRNPIIFVILLFWRNPKAL